MKFNIVLFLTLQFLINSFISIGQSIDFNNIILLQDKSTRFREIFVEDDFLWAIGDIGTDLNGLAGIFVLKLDTLGIIINSNFYRSPFMDDDLLLAGRDPVIINSSSNIIVAGELYRSRDLYLVGIDKNLDSIFYKQYFTDYLTTLAACIIELDSNYYISGFIQNLNFDLDPFIQKVDYDGNLIWSKSYGTPDRTETAHSAISENGGLTIMISESLDPSPNLNNTRYWIRFMHIDTSGAIQWDWKEEVTDLEGWSGTLLKYEDDYVYTTNLLGEEFNFGSFQAGQVVRRDSNFNVVWRQPYGEPDNYFNGLGDMIIAKDSNLLITGQILDSTKKFMLERVIRISPLGELLCEVRDTGRILDNGESLNTMEGIAESETGSIYAVGYTYLGGGFYEGLLLKIGPDGCVDTLTTSTSIDEYIHIEETGILAYPNPVSANLSFKISNQMPRDALISIYNLQGVEIRRERMSGDILNVDSISWPEGLYLVTLHKDGFILATTKVFKTEVK